jgi:chorismate-pyruvate lyase
MIDNATFNPMSDLFVAQFTRPKHLEQINLRSLTPFQRALLVLDGTVTKFIEAFTMEPVEIVRLGQATRNLLEDHPWLAAPKGTSVIARQVQLRGRYSYTFHAYAVSLIVQDRLPDPIRRGLEEDQEGLGRILLQSQLETFREVLWYGKEHGVELPPEIREQGNGEFFSRTYRIMVHRQPIMLITEKFPIQPDVLPSHH